MNRNAVASPSPQPPPRSREGEKAIDPRDALAQAQFDAGAAQVLRESLEDTRVTAANVAEHLFLQSRSPGLIHSSDDGPDERRRSDAIALAELSAQERQPDFFERPPARPAAQPVDDWNEFECLPIAQTRRAEDRQAESELVDQAQRGKREELPRVRHR